jgi:drug/metabolite transporter (DMT)-like permease
MSRATLRARVELFGSALCFGLMAVLARLGSRGADGFIAPQLTTIRFAVGCAMALALFRLRPGMFRPVNHRLLVTRGLLGGLSAFLYFLALERIPAGEATLLNNLFPVFAVILSFLTLGERPTFHLAAALAITTAGVFLVVGGGLGADFGWGQIAGLVSAVVGGGAVTSIRRLRSTDNAPTIFFAFCVGGFFLSLPFAFQRPWPADPTPWALAIAVGALSFGAQILMTDAYGALTVAEAAVWQQLSPIASFLWAVPVLGESLAPATIAGVLVGAGGVVYGTILGHKPAGSRTAPRPGEITQTAEPVEPA